LAAIFALSAYRAMEAASASRQGRRGKSVMTRSYPNSLNTSLNVTTSMKPIRATKPTVFLGSDVYRRSAELGYWLGEPFWGRGIMTAAVETMCREGFAAWDIVRIHAEAFARNAASRRVLEKAGFALEGTLRRSVYKNGEMLDSCIYALVREEAP